MKPRPTIVASEEAFCFVLLFVAMEMVTLIDRWDLSILFPNSRCKVLVEMLRAKHTVLTSSRDANVPLGPREKNISKDTR